MFELLTITFVVLKILDKIDWSWIWVLAPLWMGWGAILIVFAVAYMVALME